MENWWRTGGDVRSPEAIKCKERLPDRVSHRTKVKEREGGLAARIGYRGRRGGSGRAAILGGSERWMARWLWSELLVDIWRGWGSLGGTGGALSGTVAVATRAKSGYGNTSAAPLTRLYGGTALPAQPCQPTYRTGGLDASHNAASKRLDRVTTINLLKQRIGSSWDGSTVEYAGTKVWHPPSFQVADPPPPAYHWPAKGARATAIKNRDGRE